MGKYIKKFDTHSDYEDFIETEDFIKPNVSYCEDDVEVHYNPLVLPKDQYLTFDILTNGNIQWTKYGRFTPNKTIYASFNNGETWQTIAPETTLNVVKGDKIIFKGENIYYSNACGEDSYYQRFRSTAQFNVSGNILSLIYGDNFRQYTQLPQITDSCSSEGHFLGLFDLSCIVSAKDLIIPMDTTNMTNDSLSRMFVGNYYLEEIPEKLPFIPEAFLSNCTSIENIIIPDNITNIAGYAFYGCTSLVNVTVLATTPPTLGYSVFVDNASERKIYVPAESVNAYKAATNWSTYAADIEPIPTT